MINLKNKGRTEFTVNLRRGADYGRDTRFRDSTMRMVRPVELPTGEKGLERIERDLPGSLMWLPGETKRGLPDAVMEIPEVRRAMFKTLVVVG